jgi:hypothetical protein
VIAAAYALVVLVLVICIACIAPGRIGAVILRARWAWRCRGRPAVPGDGERLTREEIQVLGNLAAGHDVRSRT